MPEFGIRSDANLATCIEDAQMLANEVVAEVDFCVIEGHRGKIRQNLAFKNGVSKVQYPNSEHNPFPSHALDFIPWPFDGSLESWNDTARFKAVADKFKEKAKAHGISIMCGIDWGWDAGHIQFESKNGVPYPKTFKETEA